MPECRDLPYADEKEIDVKPLKDKFLDPNFGMSYIEEKVMIHFSG